ncbi:curli assembly protein CsgG [Leptospira langatensis]|uniref:Curli assembly protein CsgG n=1 Tax=Leptospira langatensis TaxID=2484983 RepID=A0A5F1ZSM0_9LEPT|nr:CsgG/HfaB family protein [Leptospira langatensis]TGK01902.1 curli assembly protein CsgG [Leptospira langatensis]TGL39551.1 curli assembly protein CsgG [Leptospira langatensis]
MFLFPFVFLFLLIDCASGPGTKLKAKDPNSATATIASELRYQFLASLKAQGGKLPARLGILDIINEEGKNSQLGRMISDRLSKELFDPKTFILLERDRLNRVVGEQTFQETGLVLSDQIVSAGKLFGAEYLTLGQVVFQDQVFLLNIRIVSLSGVICATADILFDSDDDTYSKYKESIK